MFRMFVIVGSNCPFSDEFKGAFKSSIQTAMYNITENLPHKPECAVAEGLRRVDGTDDVFFGG